MPLSLRKSDMAIQPRGIVYLLLFVALLALAHTVIHANLKLTAVVVLLPTISFILLAGAQYPMLSYTLYCIFTFYFHAIYRYLGVGGLSVVFDILIVVCVLSITMNLASKSAKFSENIRNAINVLSVGQLLWIVFVFFEYLAPYSEWGDFTTIRGFITVTPMCFLLSGIMLDTPKKLRITLVLIAVFVATAAAKTYWQKHHGWDAAEIRYLIDGDNWHTHLLRDGTVRYFSFFSDAGNHGGTMGVLMTALGIAAFALRRVWLRLVCLAGTLLAAFGMLMSGTRGCLVIPFVGMAVFVMLSKNMKAIVSTLLLGSLLFCFFAFTDIGDDNKFIHRARTAFRPDEDASFNVRLINQKRFAYYLKDKPFGVGLGSRIVDTKLEVKANEKYIPTDSTLVDIWVENGIVGLCVYLLFMGIVILRCCYVLLFRVRNPQLRLTLAGLLGAVCGLLVNAYVARTWGMAPCSVIIPIFFSFVLNGPYIDKQIEPDEDL